MICEVVAVGSELLFGGKVDTNSTWIGEKLAEHGIDSYHHVIVGDNQARMTATIGDALQRADAVIVTGGLGPTQDDITREAVAALMGEELVLDAQQRDRIAAIFAARNREMSGNNERQAMKPASSRFIEQRKGTAPGLICEVGDKVAYLVPGFPHEMKDMIEREVLPDLARRGGENGVLMSRALRTWGVSESSLAEMVASRLDALEGADVTLAFLAHGIEGIHIRITVKAESRDVAQKMLDAEEAELRVILGSLVFGVDDESMEHAVSSLLLRKHKTLSVAESLTGGLIASRLTNIPGGSAWFIGGVVSYASEVKYELLGVDQGPVVTPESARSMAEGVRKLLHSDIAISVTGVAGPTRQEDQPVGLVYAGIAIEGEDTEVVELRLYGDRQRIREAACINVLDALRKRLLADG